jgi:hypothetical protein
MWLDGRVQGVGIFKEKKKIGTEGYIQSLSWSLFFLTSVLLLSSIYRNENRMDDFKTKKVHWGQHTGPLFLIFCIPAHQGFLTQSRLGKTLRFL